MKALVQKAYGPVENLRLVELERPTPQAKALLIAARDTVSAGIGQSKRALFQATGSRLRTPIPVAGWDAAGVVESVRPCVTRFKADEVFGNCDARGTGAFAEYACLPEDRCAPKPANLSFEHRRPWRSLGSRPARSVRDLCKVSPGMRVLVVGASGGVVTTRSKNRQCVRRDGHRRMQHSQAGFRALAWR